MAASEAAVHRKITLTVCREAKVPQQLTSILSESSAELDEVPDYEVKTYITSTGRLKVKRVRVKHHGARKKFLKKLAMESRYRWLRGDIVSSASSGGRLLHYIQDGVVPSPRLDRNRHDYIERRSAELNLKEVLEKTEFKKPEGKVETFKTLELVKPEFEAKEALRKALELSYATVSSILSPSKAPEHLNHLANQAYGSFKNRWKLALPYYTVLILLPVYFILQSTYPALTAPSFLPSWILAGTGLTIILFRDVNKVLKAARAIPKWTILSNIACLALYLELNVAVAVAYFIFIASSYLIYPRSEAWRRVGKEVDWFKWELVSTLKQV